MLKVQILSEKPASSLSSSRRASSRSSCWKYLGTLLLLVTASGCNLGRVLQHAYGEEPVPAKYTLKKVPTLIFIKDKPDPTGLSDDADHITFELLERFAKHELAPTIDPGKLSDLKAQHLSDFSSLSAAEVGRTLAAEQVLFVQINTADTAQDGVSDMLKGTISATIRVIDVKTGNQLFPSDTTDGYSVNYETPMLRLTDHNTPASVKQNLDSGMTDRIAKLFYKYKPDD